MLATSSYGAEYQELSNGHVVTKTVPRTESTVYDLEKMNPVEEICGEQTVTYEYANQDNPYSDDFPVRTIEEWDGELYDDEYFEYDEYGNEIWEEDLISGDTIEIAYYGADSECPGEEKEVVETIKEEGENGKETVLTTTTSYDYSYDANGVKTETATETTDGKSRVFVSKYDKMGRVLHEEDDAGNTVDYTYDFMGRELSIVYHENGKEFKVSYVYDKNGTLLQETDRDGTVIYYTYDARNRLIQKKQVKDAEQRIWKTAYGYEWTAGEKELLSVLRQESPGGSIDETYMDQAGKTVRTCSGGLMTENEYDKDGRVTAQRITSEDGSIKGSTTVTLHDAEGSVAG